MWYHVTLTAHFGVVTAFLQLSDWLMALRMITQAGKLTASSTPLLRVVP